MDINYRRLIDYNLSQALALWDLMVAYALLLRPAGFLISTVLFLSFGSIILGERKFHILIPVAVLAAEVVWYPGARGVGDFPPHLAIFLGDLTCSKVS